MIDFLPARLWLGPDEPRPCPIVKGLIAVSCIDLLAVYGLHCIRRNSLRVGTFSAMTGMCSSGRFLPLLKQQEMGGETQGGETLAKALIAPLTE